MVYTLLNDYKIIWNANTGHETATVGGNVSTNAGGMRAVKYGVTRDYVLAMTVVLPDGRIMGARQDRVQNQLRL